MALPLWNSKTTYATLLCLHPNDGVSLGICGSGHSSNINKPHPLPLGHSEAPTLTTMTGYGSYLSGPQQGSATEVEVDQDGVANNSENLTETREESNPCHENDSGAGRSEGTLQSIFLRMFG